MALAVTLKASGIVDEATSSTGNFPSQVLGAITFAAGSVVLVITGGIKSSSSATLADLRASASGLTFTQETGAIQAGVANTAWMRVQSAPHTSGGSTVITIDTNSLSAYNLCYLVYEITGHDTGNPIGAVAQAAQSSTLDGAYSITLGAAPATSSIVISAITADTNAGANTVDPGSGWTEDVDLDSTASFFGFIESQRRTGSTSTSVPWADIRAASSVALFSTAAVAVEIVEAGGAGPNFPDIPTGSQIVSTVQQNTTATRTFPALSGLTKTAGDLLIAIAVGYNTSTGTNAAFSGWSDSFTEFHDSATNGTLAIGMAYKWSTGSETAAPTVTQAGTITGHAALMLIAIPGAHATTPPEAGSRASTAAGGTFPDPASFNPAGWDVEDTLWIAVGAEGQSSATGSWTGLTVGTPPTNFGSAVASTMVDTLNSTQVGVAFRQETAAAQDVGTWAADTTNSLHAAVVIAVRPAPSGTPLTVADARQLQATDSITLTQHHAATVADARQLQATDPIALTQHHVLVVQDARQLQATDPVAVTYHPPSTALTVADARQLQTTDPIALVQHRILTVADTRQLQSSDPVALTQHHVLAPQDARQLQATDPIALTQHRVLTVQDARQLQAADPITLTQHRVLTVADARQLQSSESPALTQHGVLAPQDARQLQNSDPITVAYHPPGAVALTVNDARQTQTVDPVALTQHNVLAPADTRQLQATDPIGLTQHHALAPQDARQLHTADPIALTQHRVLAVQDARQTQAADPIVVTYHPPGAVVVSVNDTRQLQATDPVNLTQHSILAPADARQLQSPDPINLTQHAALVVQDARQLQTADSPAVTPGKITLTVNDAKQTPTVDSPALTQHHLLTVADTRHNHPTDNPALTQHHQLAVQDARQTQKVGNVTFGRPPHITHPNLTAQTNQSALGGQTNHFTLTGQTNQSTLHTPTASTLLLEPHRHTLED